MTATLIDAAWVEELLHFETLWVGLSGGLDSTVLLHALASNRLLRSKLRAIHVNHGLSPHASAWEMHCQAFCAAFDLPLVKASVVLTSRSNLEACARKARFQVFASQVGAQDCLLLAHHRDDQAETLLLHVLRGAGVDGLAAMRAYTALDRGMLAKPLLLIAKSSLLAYAQDHQLSWVQDESNLDMAYSRNFIRQAVLPLLSRKWPSAVEAIAQCAQHCQQAKSNLADLALLDCPDLKANSHQLTITNLMHLSQARLTNVVRAWLASLVPRMPSTQVTQQILAALLAPSDTVPCVAWGKMVVRRYRGILYLLSREAPSPKSQAWINFPEPMCLPEIHQTLVAEPTTSGIYIGLTAPISIRFREGGETLKLRGKTRTLKKLMQSWGIPPWLRNQIPLIYVANTLACVLDFCSADSYDEQQPAPGDQGSYWSISYAKI